MLSLRTAVPSDAPFLLHLYATTRAEEMNVVDWSAEAKAAFLAMQFNAQQRSYLLNYPQATYQVIIEEQTPIGRLIVNRTQEELLLVNIALLPEFRNQGIGTRLIQTLQQEASAANQTIRLHVESQNQARRLYERLGFVPVAVDTFYIEMVCQTSPPSLLQQDLIIGDPSC